MADSDNRGDRGHGQRVGDGSDGGGDGDRREGGGSLCK